MTLISLFSQIKKQFDRYKVEWKAEDFNNDKKRNLQGEITQIIPDIKFLSKLNHIICRSLDIVYVRQPDVLNKRIELKVNNSTLVVKSQYYYDFVFSAKPAA